MMLKSGKNKGFTLVEVLIAISIFSVVVVVATSILINVVQLQKQNSIQDVLYEDARIIFQQIANEVHNGTIDYEEYYSVNVIQAGEDVVYGENYGAYGSRFFDPGKSLDGLETYNPEDLGTECTYPDNPNTPPEECQINYSFSADLNTGQNPFAYPRMDGELANAFCDVNQSCETSLESPAKIVEELFIIDSSGTKKTIIGKKRISGEDWGLGLVRLDGIDEDQNGLVDTFTCSEEFTCGERDLPTRADLDQPFLDLMGISNFVPLTPLRSSVKDIKFIITPVEDPYKAYNEPNVQRHPLVVVLLTLELSAESAANYPGEFPELTLQTTIAAGVIGRIDSYPPKNDVSSIKDVIHGGAKTPF